MYNKIFNENCLTGLKKLPDNSIDCCVTSPPYFGLRDYGTTNQIGLEDSPQDFVNALVKVFEEVHRVLKPEGTLWLNLGDSYATGGRGYGSKKYKSENTYNKSMGWHSAPAGLKHKDIIGIPWRVAFALQSAGWYLRQDIIWHKPNPMPESVTDRCTKAHEYIFLLSKSAKYYYDHEAIMQDIAISSIYRLKQNIEMQHGSERVPQKTNGNMKAVASWNGSSFDTGKTGEMKHTNGGLKSGNKERKKGSERGCPENTGSNVCSSVPWEGLKANKRSVWTVTTKPFKDAHFATFPEDLIVDCIKAGCPEGGIVLDPFMGAGTTALVSRKLNRNYVGFELNPEYIQIAEKRLKTTLGMFL
ncbi:MAG TPA: site-specific DNA-methyltransferase [Sediminibacterium sp.]|nr:site-specific DNA-methyltransferase [Sediminibacterium sp.]